MNIFVDFIFVLRRRRMMMIFLFLLMVIIVGKGFRMRRKLAYLVMLLRVTMRMTRFMRENIRVFFG